MYICGTMLVSCSCSFTVCRSFIRCIFGFVRVISAWPWRYLARAMHRRTGDLGPDCQSLDLGVAQGSEDDWGDFLCDATQCNVFVKWVLWLHFLKQIPHPPGVGIRAWPSGVGWFGHDLLACFDSFVERSWAERAASRSRMGDPSCGLGSLGGFALVGADRGLPRHGFEVTHEVSNSRPNRPTSRTPRECACSSRKETFVGVKGRANGHLLGCKGERHRSANQIKAMHTRFREKNK